MSRTPIAKFSKSTNTAIKGSSDMGFPYPSCVMMGLIWRCVPK
jgi:hypothetical protein